MDWGLKQRFSQLYESKRYIKSVSSYIVSLSKHSGEITKLWFDQLLKAKLDRKLCFIYVANEVIRQEKGSEFAVEFGKVLCEAFSHVSRIANCKETDKRLKKVIDVFVNEKKFSTELLREFKQSICKKRSRVQIEEKEEDADKENVNIKKRKHSDKEVVNDGDAGDALEELMRKLSGKEDRTLKDLEKLFQEQRDSIKYC